MDVMRPIHEWPEGGYGVETSVTSLAVQADDHNIYQTSNTHFADWIFYFDYVPPTRTAQFENISLDFIEPWAEDFWDPTWPRTKIFHYLNKGPTNPIDVAFENQFYCVLQAGVKLDTSVYWQWVPYKFAYIQEMLGIKADNYSKAVDIALPGEDPRYVIAIPNLPADYVTYSRYLISLSLITYKPNVDLYNLRLKLGFMVLMEVEGAYIAYAGPYMLNEVHYYPNLAYQKIGMHASIIWTQTDRNFLGDCRTPQNLAIEPLYMINQLTQNLFTEVGICNFSIVRIA